MSPTSPTRRALALFALTAALSSHATATEPPAKSMFAPHNAPTTPAADPFLGTFRGTTDGRAVEITIRLEGPKYVGSIKVGDEELTYTALRVDQQLRGQATPKGQQESMTFIAKLNGDTLTVTEGEDTVILKRTGAGGFLKPKDNGPTKPTGPTPPKNSITPPPSKITAPDEPPPPPAEPILPAGFTWHSHPAGLRFACPESWTMQQTDDGLAFTPSADAQELYVIQVTPSEAAIDLMSPEFATALESAAKQIEESAHQVGPASRITVGDLPGAIYRFEPNADDPGRLTFYVVAGEGRVYSLTALAEKSALAARQKTIESIVKTFRPQAPTEQQAQPAAQGNLDPALVGTWRNAKDSGSNTTSSRTETTVTLNADGTFRAQSYTSFVSQAGSYDNTSDPVTGRWSTSGGILTLTYDNGEQDAKPYHVAGGMIETGEGQSLRLWEPVR